MKEDKLTIFKIMQEGKNKIIERWTKYKLNKRMEERKKGGMKEKKAAKKGRWKLDRTYT